MLPLDPQGLLVAERVLKRGICIETAPESKNQRGFCAQGELPSQKSWRTKAYLDRRSKAAAVGGHGSVVTIAQTS